MEMFTEKRPTDVMFKEGLSLHQYVKEALQKQVLQILSPTIVEDIKREQVNNSSKIIKATICVLDVALSCSNELPTERLDISDASARLSSIRNSLLN
ncbi:unnamed protein product [Amaranthus hypochondriacus]